MKEKRSSESSDCSWSCASSPAEPEPIVAEHADVIQATANSTIAGNFIPQPVLPESYAINIEIPQASQITPQPVENASQYQFPDYQFNSRYVNCDSTPEGRVFFYDTSVYPTEYYPTGFESYAYNYYTQQGPWVENYDMSYLN